ncbi:Mutator-like transposase domain-containing protein [Camponotus japonicus]
MGRCTGGNTQNSNESVNACVWKLAPKHLHCGAKTVEIATYIAVSLFNEGHITLLKIMDVLGIAVGLEANNFARFADAKRVTAAENSLTDAAKAAALSKKDDQIKLQEQYEVEEGLVYYPGFAD